FGLGANYFTVGQLTADMAISILQGKHPSQIAIENIVPEKLGFNQEVLETLGSNWQMSEEVLARLEQQGNEGETKQIVIDFASGQLPAKNDLIEANLIKNLHMKYDRPAQIAMITLLENPTLEQAAKGVVEAFRESGLVDKTDFVLKKYSAQGEIAQLTSIMDVVVREKPDLVITITTPAMMAAFKRIKEIPVVFTVASDPVKLKLLENNPPSNICGVHDNPPVEEVLQMAMQYDSKLKAVGIIYDAAQTNAVLSVEKLRVAGKKHNIKVEEATASVVSDLPMATQSVIQRGAEAIILSADNLASTGFSSIHRVASGAGVPIFATEPELVPRGATGAYGDSFYEWGRQSGKIAVKVLAGLSPADLGYTETALKQRIDPKILKSVNKTAQPFRLCLVHYSDTEFAERCHEGLIDGIEKAGLVQHKDFQLKVYNAQGDMSTLSGIMANIKSEKPDLLMVISTPSLQAALRQVGDATKIVFTGVGDAVKAGAGVSETNHLPFVTGITTRSPFKGMARIIKETLPHTKA
ncbi:MAG TPA: ABC transporter substrate binding protein, partial [Bacteroidales bacterium]|nr:ABC transporter substrate binding protein [Bacteroidales bacterium]